MKYNFIIVQNKLSKSYQVNHYFPCRLQIIVFIQKLYLFHENKYINFDTFSQFFGEGYFWIANISYLTHISLKFLVHCYQHFKLNQDFFILQMDLELLKLNLAMIIKIHHFSFAFVSLIFLVNLYFLKKKAKLYLLYFMDLLILNYFFFQ